MNTMSLNVTVTLADRADPLELAITNPDRVAWDRTARRQGWPAFTEAPFLGLTFLAWAAARRTGVYTDSFEQWSEHDALDITTAAEATDDADDYLSAGLDHPTGPATALI